MPEIRCVGQAVDDAGEPVGDPCGRRYRASGPLAEITEQARAGGWSVTGPPMCPGCRRANPAIAKGLTIQQSRKDTATDG